MATINDPVTGLGASVTSRGLAVDARPERLKMLELGQVFRLKISVTPGGAGNFFFYMENKLASGRNIYIESGKFRAASAEILEIRTTPAVIDNSSTSPTAVTAIGASTSSISFTPWAASSCCTCPFTDSSASGPVRFAQ